MVIGQAADITLSAFDLRSTPVLSGDVIVVSADSMVDQTTGLPFYSVRVEIPDAELARLDEGLELLPGMPAEVYIKTGDRTALSYFTKPLVDNFRRALKEE